MRIVKPLPFVAKQMTKSMIKRTALATLSFTLLASGVMAGQNLLVRPQTAQAAAPPDTCFAFNAGTGTITDYYDHEGNNSANPACPRAVDIPSSIGGVAVTSIGDSAFSSNQLTSLTIPSSVTSIGSSAFSYNQLTSLTIPSSVTSIGDWAFSYNQLTSLTIPSSVTSIGDYAFSSNQLASLTIPSSVNYLGSRAFNYNMLTSATVIGNPETIGDGVFKDNRFLTSITYNGTTYTDTMPTTERCYSISSGVATGYKFADLNAIKNYGVSCLSWDIDIPATIGGEAVMSIGDLAFRDSYFRSVKLPSGLTSIGNFSFANNRISHVTIPSSVISVNPSAFFMQSKWGGYIEYDEPGIPYLYSKDPNVVQEIYDNFWYVRLTTEDPLNANNIKDSVISEDWYHGSDSNANGVNETYGGHLVNPASAELQYVNSANTSLRTSQTFTGKLGSNYLSNYYVTQGPTVPIPADPYNPTPAEQAALDQALSVYYRIGNTPTFTPPAIAGYITPPAQTKELTAANNSLSFTYNQQVLSVPFANNTVTGGTLAPSTTPASITSPLIKESNLAIANDGACSAIESAELLAPGAVTVPASVTILGGLQFSLSCSSAATTTVTLTLGSKANLAQLRIYKEASGTLTDITHQVTLANTNGKTVLSYETTDGGSLDEDGVANSTIVDPIYIGEVMGASSTPPGSGLLASTGANVYILLAAAATLFVGAFIFWRRVLKPHNEVSFR